MQDFSIHLDGVSKRYDMQWIFRDLNSAFHLGNTYAIKGYNGSGKSTLLRILSAMESPTLGKRTYLQNKVALPEDKIYSILSFSAPYMNLPSHLKVIELIHFHAQFKSMTITPDELLEDVQLVKSKNKLFETLSSGQKQKIKLALAICNTDPVLLLDEPGTNLDNYNYKWFSDKILAHKEAKLICIATNESRDLDMCNESLVISERS